MSNVLTEYADFSVRDYKNQAVLSSYNLSITPLTFIPNVPSQLVNTRITWFFGDSTSSNDISAVHAYEYPGTYNVQMVVYDCQANARLASYSAAVNIKDYVTNTFTISTGINFRIVPTRLSGDILQLNVDNQPITLTQGPSSQFLNLSTGQISQGIVITNYTPYYQDLQNILISISGSSTLNYFNLPTDKAGKYNHLRKFNTFYDRNFFSNINNYQDSELIEINTVTFDNKNDIYVKLSGTEIIRATYIDANSVYAGSSATKTIYFKDDGVSNLILTTFKKDNNNIYARRVTDFGNVNYLNTIGITLSTTVVPNYSYGFLTATSNGLDGENFTVNSFNIVGNKFYGTKIPFIVKVKDTTDCTVKNITGFDSSLSFKLLSGSSLAPIPSSYYTVAYNTSASQLSSIYNYENSSFTSGDLTISNVLSVSPITNVYLQVSSTFAQNSLAFNLTGVTAPFNVLPVDYYDIYKINEDFDFEQTIKDLRFQEILLDKEVFFTDFIGSIFGSVSASYDVLGKKIFERIANFVDNTSKVDTADIGELADLLSLINDQAVRFDTAVVRYPNAVRRALSLLSINKNRLFGYKNQFKENFNPRGVTTKETYGINLGDQIDTLTYTVTAGTDIVALEKFSGTYNLLNTYQPVCAVSAYQYRLSGYSSNWGWPLVLPANFAYSDINTFYNFYTFNNAIDGTILNSVIDFANPQTNIEFNTPLSTFNASNGVLETIITNTLYSSLSLFGR